MNLWPFFSYYGGKWRLAPRYPKPQYRTIVEPFAGSAGYSVRHHDHQVVLVEKDPVIASVWRYLLRVTPAELRALPNIANDQTVDDLGQIPQEAKWLVGLWLNKASMYPCKKPSAWMRSLKYDTSFWGPKIRERLASQVELIRHWRLIEGDYSSVPDLEHVTWFVDPPYDNSAGRLYKLGAEKIDFRALGEWCRHRRGQVMVCENVGATWLPFEPFHMAKSNPGIRGKGYSHEALYYRSDREAVAA